jgi:hypothetical protein
VIGLFSESIPVIGVIEMKNEIFQSVTLMANENRRIFGNKKSEHLDKSRMRKEINNK